MKPSIQTPVATHQTLKHVGHCLYRSEESQIYYAILKRGGKQIKRSLKTTDAALAKRWLAELQHKAQRLNRTESGKVTFEILADRWLQSVAVSMKTSSFDRQKRVAGWLGRYFGRMVVRSITKTNVEAWAGKRGKELSARTLNYERETLIRILDYALRDGLILDNPGRVLKRLKQAKPKIVIPTKAQFKTLVDTMRELRSQAQDGANLCEFLAYSGCRLGEATTIQWGDIDFDAKTFTVTGGEHGTKNHEARVVPLFPSLERFLRSLCDALPEPPKPSEMIFKIKSAKKSLANASRKAGLPHFSHHSLRHFFCSNAIEAGIDFKAIAGWLGHKDGGLLVAKTYGHLRDEHSTAMAQRMTFAAQTS